MRIKHTNYYSHAVVLYGECENPKGIVKFLRKDFQHCEVIMVIDDKKSLKMKMHNGCLLVVPIRTKSIKRYAKLFKHTQEIEIKNIQAQKEQVIFVGVKTCVGFAKALLNVQKALVLTPYQLYKHLGEQYK